MSTRSGPIQARLHNNSITFALGETRPVQRAPGSSSSRTYSEKSAISAYAGTLERPPGDKTRREQTSSQSQALSTNIGSNEINQAGPARTPLRTIPAWVRSAEVNDLTADPPSDYFLPTSPQSAFVARHNHSPWSKIRNPDQDPRDASPPGSPSSGRRSRWVSFAQPSVYPKEQWQSEKVEPDWLNKHFTDYSKPWLADHNEDDVEDGSGRYHAFRRKRKTWYKRTQQTILRNPMIPLVFRMTVFTFAAIALALGGSIYQRSQSLNVSQGPSAPMAIILDVVAMVYILYITYDEYTGKPLGLRPAKAKLRIILLDLFFIVFQSANLSLAFQTLSDADKACKPGDRGDVSDITDTSICSEQKALASVLLMALIAWLSTFSVSVLRLVERVVQR